MIRTLILTAIATVAASSVQAQDILPREEALKYAFLTALHEPAAGQAPLQVDADLRRPFAGHDGEYGVLILPETKLTATAIEGARGDVVPLGQLWLRRLTPRVDGWPVEASRLQMVSLRHEGESVRVPLCLLGARQSADGRLELVVFGKSKEPLLRAPLSKSVRPQTLPIEMTAERDYDSGKLHLHFAGQYHATVEVTELED